MSMVGMLLLSLLVVVANASVLAVDQPLSAAARVGSIEGVARLVSKLGGTETAVIAAVGLAALVWRRCRATSLAIPITIAVGAVANVVLKDVIGRARPPSPATGTALASFPSGHTFQATLLLGLLPLAVLILTERRDLVRWAE